MVGLQPARARVCGNVILEFTATTQPRLYAGLNRLYELLVDDQVELLDTKRHSIS